MRRRGVSSRLGVNATRVAVVSAVAITSLLVVFILLSASSGSYRVHAVFDDVRGLIPGGEVRAGSVHVGTVTEVDLNDSDDPEVTMVLDDEFVLHKGATADIRLASNVGAVNRTVELTEGDVTKPKLADGATLSAASTDQPVNFDSAVQTLNPPTRENIKRLLGGLDRSLKGRGSDLDRSLTHSSAALNETANLLGQVNRDGQALRTLVAEGSRVVSALGSSPHDLSEAADRTALLLRTTGDRQRQLARSIELLGPALTAGRRSLDRLTAATPDLRELIAGLKPVVDRLGPFARLLPRATQAAGPFLAQTRRLVRRGPRYLRQLEPIIAAADPVAKRLNPVAKEALPLGQELRAYVPETIGAFQNFGAAAGSYDRNGHVLTTAAGGGQTLPVSTAAGGVISSADCTPGQLELPYIRLPGANECDPWANFEDSFIGTEAGK